jgi:hypothetical protein
MAYGNDVSVFVEDSAGDLGAPASPAPWWISPDVDIPAHPGQAHAGTNQVRIRVHAHEEPFVDEKIVAEVYAGNPSLVMSPTTGTRRIDPANLRFRGSSTVSGSEPIATIAGATLTFDWTPSADATQPDGRGHRCLVVRAFPESVTPPTANFDVPNEQHEAQRNIEILATSVEEGDGGLGTIHDPKFRDPNGMWWEEILTRAIKKRAARILAVGLDPRPDKKIEAIVRKVLGRRKFAGFARARPDQVMLDVGKLGKEIDPSRLPRKVGEGLFAAERVVAAARVELGPRRSDTIRLGFDHSNLKDRQAVVMHVGQWDSRGRPEGGLTVVALAPH